MSFFCYILAAYRIVFAAFKEKSAAACNVIQFGYQVGGVIGPAVVKSFVDGRFSGIRFAMNGSMIIDTPSLQNQSVTAEPLTEPYPARFVRAYWIMTPVGLMVIVLCVGLYIYSRKTGINIADEVDLSGKQHSLRQQVSPRSCSPSHPIIASLLLVMLFFHIGCLFATARVYSKVIFSYDRDGPGLTVASSSLMTSSYFISSSCGILVFLVPSSLIHIKYVLQVGFNGAGAYLCHKVGTFFMRESC